MLQGLGYGLGKIHSWIQMDVYGHKVQLGIRNQFDTGHRIKDIAKLLKIIIFLFE